MSNLGAYQWITTVSKKVGGPINLLLLTGVAGAAVYKCSEVAVKKCVKVIKIYRHNKTAVDTEQTLYHIRKPGESNEGLVFVEGDQFRVLETDGDSVLIEKIGDDHNPYFVSAAYLHNLSDYEG